MISQLVTTFRCLQVCLDHLDIEYDFDSYMTAPHPPAAISALRTRIIAQLCPPYPGSLGLPARAAAHVQTGNAKHTLHSSPLQPRPPRDGVAGAEVHQAALATSAQLSAPSDLAVGPAAGHHASSWWSNDLKRCGAPASGEQTPDRPAALPFTETDQNVAATPASQRPHATSSMHHLGAMTDCASPAALVASSPSRTTRASMDAHALAAAAQHAAPSDLDKVSHPHALEPDCKSLGAGNLPACEGEVSKASKAEHKHAHISISSGPSEANAAPARGKHSDDSGAQPRTAIAAHSGWSPSQHSGQGVTGAGPPEPRAFTSAYAMQPAHGLQVCATPQALQNCDASCDELLQPSDGAAPPFASSEEQCSAPQLGVGTLRPPAAAVSVDLATSPSKPAARVAPDRGNDSAALRMGAAAAQSRGVRSTDCKAAGSSRDGKGAGASGVTKRTKAASGKGAWQKRKTAKSFAVRLWQQSRRDRRPFALASMCLHGYGVCRCT